MSNTLKLGNGKWATGKDTLLSFSDTNNNYKPLPFSFSRDSSGTVVNKAGLIETVGSGEPRIDFKDNTKGSLLLEPSRTNLYSYSNQFDVYWSKSNISAIPNSIISPEGILNGYFLRENTSNASHDIRQNATIVSGLQYTYSVFVKKSDVGQDRNLSFYIGGTNGSISFNTTNGTFFNVGSVDSYSSEDYGNGWWRLQFTDTSVSTSFNVIAILNNGSTIYSGDGVSGVYIYGAQLEQGSYATSYIPTSGSAVTRVAEVCNNGANDQVINSTEGVLYADISADEITTGRWLSLSNGTTSERLSFGFQGSTIRVYIKNTSGLIWDAQKSGIDILNYNKVGLKYKSGDYALWINGTEIATSSNSNLTSGLNSLQFNAGSGAAAFYGNIKDLKLYNTALTDQELAALTTI